jgi:hypothetical protein
MEELTKFHCVVAGKEMQSVRGKVRAVVRNRGCLFHLARFLFSVTFGFCLAIGTWAILNQVFGPDLNELAKTSVTILAIIGWKLADWAYIRYFASRK